jgi:hypothetical protein
MSQPDDAHKRLLDEAMATEGRAQRALLAGDSAAGADGLRQASRLYRASWEAAPPGAYGRLIGMLKAAVIGGDAQAEAAYVRAQVEEPGESPPAHYALAVAALVEGDDTSAARAADGMRRGAEAFVRTADAIAALAAREAAAYTEAVRAIVADFEGREQHLTGVPIADTALMLERLAEARGIAARPSSPLLPTHR